MITALPPPDSVAPPSPTDAPPRRKPRTPGRPCPPVLVGLVREMVEGTRWPMRVIAERVGVSRQAVNGLRARHGWVRPGPGRVTLSGQRGGGHPVVAEVVEAARALLEGTGLPLSAISARTGVSRTTLCRWRKRRGWRRPEEAPTFLPGPRADGRARPFRYPRQRGQPYAADAVAAVRHLVTTTLLSQAAIAARVGISQERVSAWTRRRGWVRPRVPAPGEAASRFGPGFPGGARPALARPTRFAASRRTAPLAEAGDRRGRPYAEAIRREARALWEHSPVSTRVIGARLGVHPVTVARWAKEGTWTRPPGRLGAARLRGLFGSARGRAWLGWG